MMTTAGGEARKAQFCSGFRVLCGWRGRLGPEPGCHPTCMVTLAVSRGMQCTVSSLQQPVQRIRETQDGLNMCSTSLGYSDTMSTSLSTGRQ